MRNKGAFVRNISSVGRGLILAKMPGLQERRGIMEEKLGNIKE